MAVSVVNTAVELAPIRNHEICLIKRFCRVNITMFFVPVCNTTRFLLAMFEHVLHCRNMPLSGILPKL